MSYRVCAFGASGVGGDFWGRVVGEDSGGGGGIANRESLAKAKITFFCPDRTH
jgi:hypothetical protein